MAAIIDWLTLSLAPGLGIGGYWRLVNHFHSPAQVFRVSPGELLRVPGIHKRQIDSLGDAKILRRDGEKELRRLADAGGTVLSYECPEYPPLLKELADPPPILYVLGRTDLLTRPMIAVVGSRAATSYGKRTAAYLARGLAEQSVTVVSGLALGIDAASHRGALAGEGSTVGILGCGLDVVYPRQNHSLYRDLLEKGALVTEYPLGTRPEGFRFPARNRIIAGISKGVVVVEAAKRSGSLITAQIALDYGREVFAVPGQVDSYKSEGAHWLLQQGAKLVQCVDDVMIEIDMKCRSSENEKSWQNKHLDIDPDAAALLGLLEPYPQMRESLIARSGLPASRVSELLLFLELEGLVEMLPGGNLRKTVAGAGADRLEFD